MKTKLDRTYYDRYAELEAKALADDASQEDINLLGEWFESFGSDFWNGECYEINSLYCLYPIYNEDAADDEWDIVGYEVQ